MIYRTVCRSTPSIFVLIVQAIRRLIANQLKTTDTINYLTGTFCSDPSYHLSTLTLIFNAYRVGHARDCNVTIIVQAGKMNMYRKGQIFREQYNGYLSEFYSENEIFPQTTKTDRTYVSLEMIMAGMYPPKEYQQWLESEIIWQPISIYHDSPDHGLVCIYLLTFFFFFS